MSYTSPPPLHHDCETESLDACSYKVGAGRLCCALDSAALMESDAVKCHVVIVAFAATRTIHTADPGCYETSHCVVTVSRFG